MKSIHDPTYYKKMHKSDSRAVKDLTGHGRKKRAAFKVPGRKKRKRKKGKRPRSYIKSGGPFNLDPPKRRSANKLSAPPGAMEETDILQEDESADNKRFVDLINGAPANSKLSFTVKAPVKARGLTAFKPDVIYTAIVQEGGTVLFPTTEVYNNAKESKAYVIKMLTEKGWVCNTLDCKASEATIGGETKFISKWLKAPVDASGAPSATAPTRAPRQTRVRIHRAPVPVRKVKETPYRDLGKAFKNLFMAAGAEPLVTATPLPGVGMAIPFGNGTFAIADIDLTGPGVGVGIRPDAFGISPKTVAKILRKHPTNQYKEYADRLDNMPNIPIVYIGVELHGAIPLPFAGLGGTDKEVKEFNKWIGGAAASEEDKSVLGDWIKKVGAKAQVAGAVGIEVGKSFMKSIGLAPPPGLDLDPVLSVVAGLFKSDPELMADVVMRVALLEVAVKATMLYGAKAATKIVNNVAKKTGKARKKTIKKWQHILGTEILIGDSQISPLIRPLRKELGSPLLSPRVLKGASKKPTPKTILTSGKEKLEKLIKKKPSVAIIALGGGGIQGATELVNKFPKETRIIWVGPAPAVKITDMARAIKVFKPWCCGADEDVEYMIDTRGARRRDRAKKLGDILAPFNNVIYINPHDPGVLPPDYINKPGRGSDGIHYTRRGAAAIAKAVKAGIKRRVAVAPTTTTTISEPTGEEIRNIQNFVEGDASALKPQLQMQLIKLAKFARAALNKRDAKVFIKSGIRKDSANHGPGDAADMRISVEGSALSAQKTYALIISAIVNGAIKDGGVGYYANNTGTYNPARMDANTEYPHYDIGTERGVRKWFWFKCDDHTCGGARDLAGFKKQGSGNDEYQISAPAMTAVAVAKDNPLGLPKDVFDLIGTYKQRRAPTGTSAPGAVVEAIQKTLSPQKKNNAMLIEQKFKAAGWSNNVIAAAIVASWGESRLNAKAIGDCRRNPPTPKAEKTCAAVENKVKDAEDNIIDTSWTDGKGRKRHLCNSVGLFQLYNYGVGKGMTCKARQDPDINIDTLLIKQKRRIQQVADLDKAGGSIADLVKLFALKVEVSKPIHHAKYPQFAREFFDVERLPEG